MIIWEFFIWICVIISYFCILIFLWNLACFVRFTRWCFSCFSLRLRRDDVNDIVMQESMHFLFKLQSISLEKHSNGFVVVHLLSVRPTSVRDHPLWDEEREREREREREKERERFLPSSFSAYISCSSSPHSDRWKPQWLTSSFESVSCVCMCVCIVCIQTSTYRAHVCVCVSSAFRLPRIECVCLREAVFPRVVCVKWVVPDWNENKRGAV